MKKILLMAAILLVSVGAFAQRQPGTFTIQPKVGLNITTLTNGNGTDARLGFVGGAEGEYQFTDLVSFSAGLLYSMQGCESGDNHEFGTIKLDYLNIPVLANVYVWKGLAVKAGVQFGFNVNSKVSAPSGSYQAGFDAKTFDFSIPVGVSWEFRQLPIVIEGRYNIGATKIADGVDSRNSVFQFTVGYKFDL